MGQRAGSRGRIISMKTFLIASKGSFEMMKFHKMIAIVCENYFSFYFNFKFKSTATNHIATNLRLHDASIALQKR